MEICISRPYLIGNGEGRKARVGLWGKFVCQRPAPSAMLSARLHLPEDLKFNSRLTFKVLK